ncbi:MAG: hypothetical protein AAFQ37_05630 [Bacteroidota bacterium]
MQESTHVFIDGGLRTALEDGEKEINILEMGFGTGLNVYLTYLLSEALPVRYVNRHL